MTQVRRRDLHRQVPGRRGASPSTTAAPRSSGPATSATPGWPRCRPAQRDDVVSPRDGEGHGSHTASIAVGNHGVRAVVDDRDFGRISGVAPAAKIAAYKVLWQAKDAAQSGAYDSDILAAIDAAIGDGVDVINFSISSADDPTSPVQLAFLAAASAGIFVATSAGNSGPGCLDRAEHLALGDHGRSSHDRALLRHRDPGQRSGVRRHLHHGRRAGRARPPGQRRRRGRPPGRPPANATACAPNSLDPAKTAGTIVVCARGVVTGS